MHEKNGGIVRNALPTHYNIGTQSFFRRNLPRRYETKNQWAKNDETLHNAPTTHYCDPHKQFLEKPCWRHNGQIHGLAYEYFVIRHFLCITFTESYVGELEE